MPHKMFKVLTVILIILVVGTAAEAADPQIKQKITIVNAGDALHYFPVYVARGAGFFAEEGLEVDWVNVSSGTRQAASVMGGSAEMTCLAFIHVIKSHVQGANLIAFASLFDVWSNVLVLSNEAIEKTGITPTMSIDEKVKRLAGLQIAITSPGSSTDAFMRSLFYARGMDPDKLVKFQPMGTGTSQLAALEKKLTDGIVFPAPIPEIAVAKGLGKIAIDPFSGEVPELNGIPMVVMATNLETLSKKPEVIRKSTRALTKALIFAHKKPEETRKMMRQYFPELEEHIYNRVVETYSKATSKTPVVTAEQTAKQVTWMNLGSSKPISVEYGKVFAIEPARTIAADLLK